MRSSTFLRILLIGFAWGIGAEIQAQNLDSAWARYAALPESQKVSKPVPTAYRIQLFSGSRSDALALRNKSRALVPDSNVTMQFDAPYFKVYAGVYTYRMQAERHLPAWRLLFPGAFVVEAPLRRNSIPKERLRTKVE
jgi:hypothetical protein